METYNQGAKDVFLAGVRADFHKIEDQAFKSYRALETYSLMGTDSMSDSLFYKVRSTEADGSGRNVWRHIGTTGTKDVGTRKAGGTFPEAEFIRNYETAVYDSDVQDASRISVPDERLDKEKVMYRSALNRASKLLTEMNRKNIADPFEVFNLAFTAPSGYPSDGNGNRFFGRGNLGLDGNNTDLNERLVSIQHARADGGATQSNAIQSSGNARPFSDEAYHAAIQQGSTFKDDVGKEMPMFGGTNTMLVSSNSGNVRTAKELNESSHKIDTANNNINVFEGNLVKIISSPFLNGSRYNTSIANTTQFFLVDHNARDADTGCGLVAIDFVPLQTDTKRLDEVDSVAYTVKQSKKYGFTDWRCIIGSNGTATAYSS